MDIQGFDYDSRFLDIKHFPVGFARCGEFTLQQAEILEQYGNTLSHLEQGIRPAKTAEEKHFVAVCKGKKPATTLLEKAWLKYHSLIHQEHVVSPFGQLKPQSLDATDYADLQRTSARTEH